MPRTIEVGHSSPVNSGPCFRQQTSAEGNKSRAKIYGRPVRFSWRWIEQRLLLFGGDKTVKWRRTPWPNTKGRRHRTLIKRRRKKWRIGKLKGNWEQIESGLCIGPKRPFSESLTVCERERERIICASVYCLNVSTNKIRKRAKRGAGVPAIRSEAIKAGLYHRERQVSTVTFFDGVMRPDLWNAPQIGTARRVPSLIVFSPIQTYLRQDFLSHKWKQKGGKTNRKRRFFSSFVY